MKLSTALRNHMLDSGSFAGALNGGVIKIYDGTAPASPDDAVPGTANLLVTLTEGGNAGVGLNFETSASGGAILKDSAESWEGTVDASGTASWFRFVPQNDDGSASTTYKRIQGSVGQVNADMNLSSTSLSSGANQTIDFFSVSLPSG